MLGRLRAKRDAIDEEIALHKAAINNLIDRREVYDEIIKDEENYILTTAENCDANTEDEEVQAGIAYAEID